MHDSLKEEAFEEPEKYWTEEEWEKRLLENERLMDRYENAPGTGCPQPLILSLL